MDCNWNEPGHAPYRQFGAQHVASALQHYDIPPEARAELLRKIVSMREDATVFIGRDDIDAAFGTASNLRNMHYKTGKCSGPVARDSWVPEHREPALVYCSSEQYCVAIPIVCGNISQIDYAPDSPKWKDYDGYRDQTINTVPEPLGLGWLALFLGWCFTKRNLKTRIT